MKKNDLSGIQEYLKSLGLEVDDAMMVATKEAAVFGSKELKKKSKEKFGGTGKYAKGWTYKQTRDGYVIYNKPAYRLTHLLENGHYKVDRNGVSHGFKSGTPHIKPTEDDTADFLEKAMMEELDNL